jgi:peptide-methionine (S)-S-oxide reductase
MNYFRMLIVNLKKDNPFMLIKVRFYLSILFLITNVGCLESTSQDHKIIEESMTQVDDKNLQIATFGSGCFWCTEAIFERVKGVKSVVSGYSGGSVPNPTYDAVCSGKTGHAEVVQIKFDSSLVSYDELLEIYWKMHDPTTLNRQGADVGTQYRSVIFYRDIVQKNKAESYKSELSKAGIWNDPIVTEISPLTKFYVAEKYHQDYYDQNPNQGYCTFVITPKLDKFEKVFKDKLKK